MYIVRRDLIDIYLWGEFAHVSEKFREIINIWSENHLGIFMLDKFVLVLQGCLEYFKKFEKINESIIQQIIANLFWRKM